MLIYYKFKFKLFKFINLTKASEICFDPSSFKFLQLSSKIKYIPYNNF